MPPDNLTKSANVQIAAREIDFVTRFARNWDELRTIIGIMRPIAKAPGTKLVSKYAELNLQIGSVGEGETIPYSEAFVKQREYAELKMEKFAKGVSLEAIAEHGYDAAVNMTDAQFLTELQSNIMDRFYAYIKTGTLRSHETTFQMALAMALGRVKNRWKEMHKGITNIVGFCNILDAYEYLGATAITTQNLFGMTYIENFLGFTPLFLLSDNEIPRGNVIATPVENIVLYYTPPSVEDFVKAGFDFRTDGVTNLIGFHAQGSYSNDVSESHAIMAAALFSEYLDGIAVIDFGTAFNDVTVSAAPADTDFWGTAASAIQSGVTVANGKITGTLKKLTSGALVNDWGEGHFLGLAFSGMTETAGTSVKVGLVPTQGAGFQTLDADKLGVWKISNKNTQRLEVITTDGKSNHVQTFDLSGLTLEE